MTIPKVVPLPFERVVDAVRQWIADRPEHFAADEFTPYPRDEWRKRGEDYGNNAVGTLLLNEGGVFKQLVNFDWLGKTADDLYEDFIDLLTAHGYMHELGYSWTMHLYPLDA